MLEKFDVIIVGEGGHGVRGITGGVEAGFGDEGGDDAAATGGDDAEEGVFGGGELFWFEAETARGAGFELFAGEFLSFATRNGTVGEGDFAAGTLATGGDGM